MKNKMYHGGPSSAVYGLGFIGAVIYYWQHSANFLDVVFGLLKAMVWPAFLIHKVFTLLGM